MRVSASIVASMQQSQIRDKNGVHGRSIDDTYNDDKLQARISEDKFHDNKVDRIREQLKNGNYKIDLAATADKMAQSLLNL